MLVVSSLLYGSEVFVKFTVNGPHAHVSCGVKLTKGVGYMVTVCVVSSGHPLLVVAISSMV